MKHLNINTRAIQAAAKATAGTATATVSYNRLWLVVCHFWILVFSQSKP